MRTRDWVRYHKRYEPAILGMARNLAGSDDALAEDLAQEGRTTLFMLDPSKAKRNRDAWVRQALWNRMVDFLRKYDPKRYESLDHRLSCGDQVERLSNGEFYLITSRPRPPRLVDDARDRPEDVEEED